MRALTLTQPWATLVAIGAKKIETRPWQTRYRGELAIHAAKGFPKQARVNADSDFAAVLHPHIAIPISSNLPRGVIVATCTLVDIVPTVRLLDENLLSEEEYSYGDYSYGRWGWILENVKALDEPIPARGALSIWEWTA